MRPFIFFFTIFLLQKVESPAILRGENWQPKKKKKKKKQQQQQQQQQQQYSNVVK